MIKERLTNDWFENLIAETKYNFAKMIKQIKSFLGVELKQKSNYTIDGREFSYPYEVDLYKLFKYVRGEKVRWDGLEVIIKDIEKLIWNNTFIDSRMLNINWSQWEDTNLGFLIRSSKAKLKYDKGQYMTPKELSILANVTPNAIRKQIKEGRLIAEKNNKNEWHISKKEYVKVVNYK